MYSKLTIKNLSKIYDHKYALKNVSATFTTKKIYGILGTNGAGKSTLLKAIYGIIMPTAGEIYIDEESVIKNRNLMKEIAGYLPELPVLNDYLTVNETIEGALNLRGYGEKESRIKAGEFIRWLNLENFKDILMVNCSKGIKQKVAFGIAAVHDPSILLLDEPFMGLDPPTVFILKEWLNNKRMNSVILVTSHMASIIEEVADELLILNNGEVIVQGSVGDVVNRSSSKNLEEALYRLLVGKVQNG